MLGVVIGNSAFLVMASLGQSAKQYAVQRLEEFNGPNRLVAYFSSSQDQSDRRNKNSLFLHDAYALERSSSALRAVAPVVGETYYVQRVRGGAYAWITGTTSPYLTIKNETVEKGRFFSRLEVKQGARVAVLGSDIANRIFRREEPVGNTIAIKNVSFRVIGVMRPKGSLGKGSPDEFIYIPISTFTNLLRGISPSQGVPVDYIEIAAKSKEQVKTAKFQVTNILRGIRGTSDFKVAENIPQQELISQVSSSLTVFLGILAVVSLTIGGIGIMNVMLVTVSERKSEVGLRKAIGAPNHSILMLFLVESSILSAFGALIGLFISVLIVICIAAVSPLPFVLPIWAVIVSVSFSTIIGVIFGVSPAVAAAKMDPIRALRSG